MTTNPSRTVLIADDETLFTQSLAEGLAALEWGLVVRTAGNGREAVEVLRSEAVDLVVTDLKMPDMDGFELLAWMSRETPNVPVIVMTAFGTPEIAERLRRFGLDGFVEKPVEFAALSERISAALDDAARGYVTGIPLSTFLQILEIERKSCTLRVHAGTRTGLLHLVGGAPWDAEAGALRGEAAAAEIVCWGAAGIEILPAGKGIERRVQSTLGQLLLEAFRVLDEQRESVPASAGDSETGTGDSGPVENQSELKEGTIMSAVDKLKELSSIEGFAGAGLFTPTGEALTVYAPGTGFSKEIGILANNVLMNAQKASLEMGAGRGQQVHVEGEKAHILARCLNEGTDPLKSQPGKAHIHMVVALTSDGSIGLAKMRVNQVIEKLAEDFRL
ncbi:MAG: response regulator [Thermoanaerobaculia bacterium]|jgi:CheY-like chemotaxis protein/predicted regulator of Ras-like GTPase activity (Roadblock/LC7/MglB family)|nr:response regulator [Thermoanaerobaculia bacterium]